MKKRVLRLGHSELTVQGPKRLVYAESVHLLQKKHSVCEDQRGCGRVKPWSEVEGSGEKTCSRSTWLKSHRYIAGVTSARALV